MIDGKSNPITTFEGRLIKELSVELWKFARNDLLTKVLFMSCIDTLDKEYQLNISVTYLNRKILSDIMRDTDVMSDTYRPLSELVLQRKISEKEDKQKAAIEVELILWEHGRNKILQNEPESRTSG